MEEQRTPILKVEEIKDGYLVTMPNGALRSFQWSSANDQRFDLICLLINQLGMKYNIKIERRV